MNKKFTLIEMMLVLAVIAILFGLGTAMFSKATEITEQAQLRAQVQMLDDAMEQYHIRFGEYPPMNRAKETMTGASWTGITAGKKEKHKMMGIFNICHYLSKVAHDNPNWQGERPMFIKYKEVGFDYDENSNTIFDPWGNTYYYFRHVSRLDGHTGTDANGDGIDDGLSAGNDSYLIAAIGANEYEGHEFTRLSATYEDYKDGKGYRWVVRGWYEEGGVLKSINVMGFEHLITTINN